MNDPIDMDSAVNLSVAALAGLAVGIEREWSGHATGPHARLGGIRTFFLIGTIGGLAGLLVRSEMTATGVAIILPVAALIVAAYVMAARRTPEDVDATSEVAALLVLTLGVFAGLGYDVVVAALAALGVFALGEKSALQRLVGRIGIAEMHAALQFAVLALVVLPLLPVGPLGPLGVFRPRMLWTFVLVFSAVNFAGYVLRRAFGDRGFIVTGALAGFVGSTALTMTFARLSCRERKIAPALALGIVASCTILFVREVLVLAVLNPAVALHVVPNVALPFSIGCIAVWVLKDRVKEQAGFSRDETVRNPLALGNALQMAVIFEVVLLATAYAQTLWGGTGFLASAAVIGVLEPDAVVLSAARIGSAPAAVNVAAAAVGVAIVANTALKMALAMAIGSSGLRSRATPILGAIAIAGAVSVGLLMRFPP